MRKLLILPALLLAGCMPPAPSAEAVKAAVEACERAGGTFNYFHGGTVQMNCDRKTK